MPNSINFFTEQRDQSKIKTAILTKYFGAWSKILLPRSLSKRIAYIDLFSGPGIYSNGEKSTPLLILEQCLSDDKLCNSVVTIFNDANKEFSERLSKNINSMNDINKLKYSPVVLNKEIGSEIANFFNGKSLIPTLAFIDPWGYKGLTINLINSLIKDFGSDCIFFFNYNRINMGLNNQLVKEHMDALFGEKKANKMRVKVKEMAPEEKELYIVNELAKALTNKQINYVLPFRFIDENKNKTSHYLIFVSKHQLGYTIMKEIMAKESTLKDDGVSNFSYIPTKHIKKYTDVQLDLLNMYERPLDELGQDLILSFLGETKNVIEIFDNHHIGTPFTKANYKEAIRRLEENNEVILNPPAEKRRMIKGVRTVGDNVKVIFPKQKNISSLF